jgi:hypothetical protein
MKVIENIIKSILKVVLGITIVFALLMAIIEARFIFSFDWSIYDSSFLALVRYLCRLALAIFTLITCFMEFKALKSYNKYHATFLMFSDISLFIASVIILIFSANYIGLVCIILGSLLLLLKASLNLVRLKIK